MIFFFDLVIQRQISKGLLSLASHFLSEGLNRRKKEYVSNGKRGKVGWGGIYGRNTSLERKSRRN